MAETEVARLLADYRAGDAAAFDALVAFVYDDLRRLARSQRRRRGAPATLDTTALVHEAYLKLAGARELGARDRGHFLAVAARAMRQILVDHARAARRDKRGGGGTRVELDEERLGDDGVLERVLAVDLALRELAEREPRLARVVECRFFAGLSIAETAQALEISHATVERDWSRAKRELGRRTGSLR